LGYANVKDTLGGMTPKVSIIIPIYNAGKSIVATLDSACSQTLRDVEIICVDDCSTDDSIEIVRGYGDSRIKIIQMPENSGAGPARNTGIESAKGQFIAFIDPDDLYASDDCLKKLYLAAVENNHKVCGGNLLEFYYGNPSSATDWEKATFTKTSELSYADYLCAVGYTRFIYDRKMIVENDFKFPPLRRYQDPVWFVQVMTHVKSFYAMDMPVYLYRKNHQVINFTLEKIDHVLTGMTSNLKIFRERDFFNHYNHEQRELKNFIYKMIYRYPKMETINLIRGHARKSQDIDFKIIDVVRFLKIGVIMLKSKMSFYYNKIK